jgi:hypothetical protein
LFSASKPPKKIVCNLPVRMVAQWQNTNQHKVKGLIPAIATGTGREKVIKITSIIFTLKIKSFFIVTFSQCQWKWLDSNPSP